MKQGNDNLALWIKRTNMIIQRTNKKVSSTGIDRKTITSFIPTQAQVNPSREEHHGLAPAEPNNCTEQAKTRYYRQMNISEHTKLWKAIQKIQYHKPQNKQMYSQSDIR